jgi:ceramide glucosyltransferase
VDYLADDFELGKRVSNAGYKVVIAAPVVETFLPDYRLKDFFEHQLRWGRTVRSSRLAGYFGLGITFGMLWALLTVVATSGAWWSWMLLAGVLVLRFAITLMIGKRILGDRDALSSFWLLLLRDLIAPIVWLLSLFGNRIVWRGKVFTLRDGKLRRN